MTAVARTGTRRCLTATLWLLTVCPAGFSEPPEVVEPEAGLVIPAPSADEEFSDWFLLVAAANTYPKLESEDLVDKYLNTLIHLLAPTHEPVDTVSDLRDDHLLWPWHIGIGKNLNENWSFFWQAGYTAGKVRSKDTSPSILILPLHTDFEIWRSAAYTGFGLDLSPWGGAKLGEYPGLKAKLAGARPFLGYRCTLTYAGYKSKTKLGLKPIPVNLSIHLDNTWLTLSFNYNVGLDIPLGKRDMLTMNAGYNVFNKRGHDFEGWAYNFGWKRFFRQRGSG